MLCCLLLGACAETAVDGPESYVVRPHDTLYSVAWRHDLDFRDLAHWNNIGADFRISVGQVLLLGPPRYASIPARPPPQDSSAGASRAQEPPQVSKPRPLAPPPANVAPSGVAPSSSVAPPPSAPNGRVNTAPGGTPHGRDSTAVSAAVNGSRQWVWPTERIGAPRAVPSGGILLAGRLGQDVRAASAGRVVYAGGGIRGYGNLIIIKHADSLLSAYAHNREMLVHDGQEVATGQVIAHMGETAAHAPILYFEIRQNGKPIDPLPFISK
jgi:lipoprotein NlpD